MKILSLRISIKIMMEQDKGLDALHNVIRRQKEMAHAIGNEVNTQNELLDDIEDGIDRTRERLINTTETARNINSKGGTCKYWSIIIPDIFKANVDIDPSNANSNPMNPFFHLDQS
ncbi:STX8 [Lepeophtheirus salmonis]|uniref:STX8 n=1 Tax=Lepeophtheirus salmonis TaxID=72036 RepID=A0A7R8CC75_LEPSM|nr:STX8 [Lepeophtheirus salmonis]CAF2765634.1 STX8 [Lepeophtheirus salmonis]